MPVTGLADLIIPEVVSEVASAVIVEKTALIKSGVATADYNNVNIKSGGEFIKVPFWSELTGDDEVISDAETWSLTPDKITQYEDIGVICHRGRAWSSAELAAIVSGSDPTRAIGEQLGNYWSKRYDAALISVLKGALPSTHINDISQQTDGQPPVSATVEALIDTMGLLGDNANEFTTIIMHSKVYNDFLKAGLIQFGQTNLSNVILENGEIPTLLGRRVIVSDNVPVETYNTGTTNYTKYTTYIAQNGAMYFGFQRELVTETDRDILGFRDYLSTQVHFCPHLRGVKWATTTTNPDNTTLATPTNWQKVYPDKAIRVVALKSN